jgi:DNA invertase Pin-like site-specific DNA recombinase
MGPISDAQQRVRELFDAHFTISEIVERTALEIQTVVRLLNAPRAAKQRPHPPELVEVQSPRLGG